MTAGSINGSSLRTLVSKGLTNDVVLLAEVCTFVILFVPP